MCFTPVVSCIDRLPRGYLKGPRACLPRAAWSCGWASVVADVSRAAPSYAMICTSRGRETSTGRGHKKRCVYLVIIGCVIGWFSCVRDEAVVDQTDQADQLFNDLPTRGVKNWEFNGGPNDYDYVFDAVRNWSKPIVMIYWTQLMWREIRRDLSVNWLAPRPTDL